MRISWLVAVMLLWVGGTLISQTLEYLQPMSVEGAETLWSMMQTPMGGALGALEVVKAIWAWAGVVWTALRWDYSFFVGVWVLFKYLGWCLSVGTAVCLFLAIRGTGSA